MERDYPLERVQNRAVEQRFENPRFSTARGLLSSTGKLDFSRPLSKIPYLDFGFMSFNNIQ
ncbi:hypothetical protein BH11PAT3_BH11PAT3_0300 [soil metagenome]